MFSTFIAWQLLQWGLPYWAAFFLTIGISFAAGVLIERIVFKPIQNADVLSHIVIFIALFAIINSGAGLYLGLQHQAVSEPVRHARAVRQRLISSHERA